MPKLKDFGYNGDEICGQFAYSFIKKIQAIRFKKYKNQKLFFKNVSSIPLQSVTDLWLSSFLMSEATSKLQFKKFMNLKQAIPTSSVTPLISMDLCQVCIWPQIATCPVSAKAGLEIIGLKKSQSN